MPLHEELAAIQEPVLRKVLDHPFWSGLREGTLPGAALARFVEQDTGHLLPSYARALARCAAAAPDDDAAYLFGQSVVGTLDAKAGLIRSYTSLSDPLELPALDGDAPVLPATHAHGSFFTAASAASFEAGVGALLPMVWFNSAVSNDLRDRAVADSRYLPWITAYHPGEDYHYAVQAFLDLVDRIGDSSSPRQRDVLVEQFTLGIRHEWAFAESCAGQFA
jgi:thiaminase/transcriptional activator TenA